MKHTWLVSNKNFQEVYSYSFLLVMHSITQLLYKNTQFRFTYSSLVPLIRSLFLITNHPNRRQKTCYESFRKQKLSLEFFKKPYPFLNAPTPSSNPTAFPRTIAKPHLPFINYNIINLLNTSLFNRDFRLNTAYRLLYAVTRSGKVLLTNYPFFLQRWQNSYALLTSWCAAEPCFLTFGSFWFKHEILALNRFSASELTTDWRYYFPFFVYKLSAYNHKSDFFFKKLRIRGYKCALVSNCSYHFKNLYYLNKHQFFTIGLTPPFINPWLVTYPVPILNDSRLTELFFLKVILIVQKKNLYNFFVTAKKTWMTSLPQFLNFFKI